PPRTPPPGAALPSDLPRPWPPGSRRGRRASAASRPRRSRRDATVRAWRLLGAPTISIAELQVDAPAAILAQDAPAARRTAVLGRLHLGRVAALRDEARLDGAARERAAEEHGPAAVGAAVAGSGSCRARLRLGLPLRVRRQQRPGRRGVPPLQRSREFLDRLRRAGAPGGRRGGGTGRDPHQKKNNFFSRVHFTTPDRARQQRRKPRKERRRRRGRPRLGGTTQPGAADRLSVADANASAAKGGVMRCALSLGGSLLGLLGLGGGFLLRGGGFLLCRALLLRRRGLSVGVLLLEAVDAPLRVDQLLLPGEERVAIAADVEVQVAVRRPRLPGRAARAVHLGGRVGRVDVLAHVLSRKGCE